jgi:hypothetical protein
MYSADIVILGWNIKALLFGKIPLGEAIFLNNSTIKSPT